MAKQPLDKYGLYDPTMGKLKTESKIKHNFPGFTGKVHPLQKKLMAKHKALKGKLDK